MDLARKGLRLPAAFLCPIIDGVKVALDLVLVDVTGGLSPLEVDLLEVAGCCVVELIDANWLECEAYWV